MTPFQVTQQMMVRPLLPFCRPPRWPCPHLDRHSFTTRPNILFLGVCHTCKCLVWHATATCAGLHLLGGPGISWVAFRATEPSSNSAMKSLRSPEWARHPYPNVDCPSCCPNGLAAKGQTAVLFAHQTFPPHGSPPPIDEFMLA